MLKHKFALNSIPGVQMHTGLCAYCELRWPLDRELLQQFTGTLASEPFRVWFVCQHWLATRRSQPRSKLGRFSAYFYYFPTNQSVDLRADLPTNPHESKPIQKNQQTNSAQHSKPAQLIPNQTNKKQNKITQPEAKPDQNKPTRNPTQTNPTSANPT
jgi:hypothetical protein